MPWWCAADWGQLDCLGIRSATPSAARCVRACMGVCMGVCMCVHVFLLWGA